MKPFVLKQKTKTSTKKDISQKNTQYNYVFLTNKKAHSWLSYVSSLKGAGRKKFYTN